MRIVMVVLGVAAGLGSAHGQPLMKMSAAIDAEMKTALAPLSTLNEQQTKAVSALALAFRAGMSVDAYCPPLKRFSSERVRCEAQVVSYVREKGQCKSAHPERDCPAVAAAEAVWSACEYKKLGEELMALGLVAHWVPIPQPDPVPSTK